MLTLLLLRHAKAAPGEATTADFDRPLTGRGRRAAQAIGRRVAALGPMPERVLCSPARRARQTWEIVAEELPTRPDTVIDEALYDFGDGQRLLVVLAARADGAETVMIVGHNPAIESLARRLAATGDANALARLSDKYPTGGLAVLRFATSDWSAIANRRGQLLSFTRPRDLAPEERE
ncbi:MAG: histidine phosphatase family protein [Rhizobiales bacterium]|nr:histidine phosphatase family protein [Hyphomicrobiales bacterium]MBI3672200.1 histidine phosphatase family protein [Hyphomicrobiales bacterium]